MLGTGYQYGLNDKGKDWYKNEKTHELFGKYFPNLNKINQRVAWGKLHKNNTFSSTDDFLNKFNSFIINYLSNTNNIYRT